jgi:sugar diacid utilization regulator
MKRSAPTGGSERQRRSPSAPPANDVLAGIAERIRGRKEELARQVVDRFLAEIVDYRLAADELRVDAYALTLANVEALLDELESGEPVPDDELERVRIAAARRAHEVSLEAYLRAWRLFGETAWSAVLTAVRTGDAAEHRAALEAAARLLHHLDSVTTAGVQAYLGEVQNPLSDLRLLRRDLLESLVSGKGESEQIRRRAQALRVRLSDAYVVVVVRGAEVKPPEAVDRPEATYAALRRIVEGVRSHLVPADGPLLVGVWEGEVVVLYPAATPAGVESVREACADLAADLAADGISIGMSGWHAGVAALATGYEEARAAERLAEGTGSSGALGFDEVLIDHIVRSSPAIERALDETLRPLVEYDRARQTHLVATLGAYVDAGFNVTKSAAALHVHPNSVVYRLHRIKELTAHDVHDPNELLVLILSIRRAALTGRGPR